MFQIGDRVKIIIKNYNSGKPKVRKVLPEGTIVEKYSKSCIVLIDSSGGFKKRCQYTQLEKI
jgi:ribosomal protein L21E